MRALGRRAMSAERISEPLGASRGYAAVLVDAARGASGLSPGRGLDQRVRGAGASPRPASGRAASPSVDATAGAVGVLVVVVQNSARMVAMSTLAGPGHDMPDPDTGLWT